MSKGLHIAAMEPNSGKSLVVLGVVELLSTRVQQTSGAVAKATGLGILGAG